MGKKDGILRYADQVDKLLMLLGTLGSMGDGLQIPLMMFVLSDVINDYGNLNSNVPKSSVDKVKIELRMQSPIHALVTQIHICYN